MSNTHRPPEGMTGAEQAIFLPPGYPVSNPIGLVAPAILQSHHSLEVKQEIAKVAAQLVADPLAMQQFCDRVYQLLCDDIQAQQERSHSFGRRC